ncbi:hypothetical protein F0P96_14375 [Hymenobacter busanensis]|uniref:Uncharacterized protein n=1 Tax=Hymenobacter busanensis TaxID=2607656 RepID=A0A7L5A3R8_9BACT|nr:hypothetical protein [Hymenobacter busanensis]KAA9331426.1 hypothetical protein F0P96_14375 [Hymenobacter busanensis]QHJ08580.1 hypothetical protein GUY19_15305 [Hymenobacter busanensis]
MKKVALLATLALACTFTACKKDDDKKSKTELLTAKSWRVTADKQTTTVGTQSSTDDNYAGYQACEKDDFVKFMTDKKLEFNEGGSKCSTADPQTETGAWDFNSDETKLTIREQGNTSGITFDIVELSGSTLKLKHSITQSNITYVTELSYGSF